MVQLRVSILARVVFDADRGPREVLQVVTQLDEEDSVVAILVAYLLFERRGPQVGLIRPVTLPFALPPRVSKPEKLDFFALVLELVNRDQRVGMAGNDALIVPVLTLPVARGHHCESALICGLKHVEEVFGALDGGVVETLGGDTHDMTGCEAR